MTPIEKSSSRAPYTECVEQFVLGRNQCREWPFFAAFDCFMEEFLSSESHCSEGLSYAIWGGVASEVVLGVLGLCSDHFSIHDIEIFLVCDGKIVVSDTKTQALNDAIATDSRFLMDVGGVPIARKIGEISLLEFQRQRLLRNDGDLCLNGLLLSIDRILGIVNISGPIGTIESLKNPGVALGVKSASDIDSVERAYRRICRNVAKAIRFEHVAGLSTGKSLENITKGLVRLYCEKVDRSSFVDYGLPCDLRFSVGESGNINGGWQGSMTSLWATTLSETIKRLAGLKGCSSLDKAGFEVFFFECAGELLRHPLVHAVESTLADSGWVRVEADSRLLDRCFADFERYQKPCAELLCAKYSLRPEKLQRTRRQLKESYTST